MISDWVPVPGLWLFVNTALVFFGQSKLRNFGLVVVPLVGLVVLFMLNGSGQQLWHYHIFGYALALYSPTAFGLIFAAAFLIMTSGALIYSAPHASRTELFGCSLYAASAVSIVLCGDFITLFIFWECLAVGSTIVILSGKMPASVSAAFRYVTIHVAGGAVLLFGIIGVIVSTGNPYLRPLDIADPYALAILIGFLVNLGAPPLSSWIADSYPESSPFGGVFLSAFTTKTAVFALLTVFAGTSVLVPIGLFMVFYGIIYALLENDMRRILAYSIVNQVGFMVLGVGLGTALAQNAAAAHAFAHIIYKGLLFMSAGSVLYMTGKRKCTDLGGLHSSMKVTMVCGIVGAVSISAVPLTSGFAAKVLIIESALELHRDYLWLALLAASAGVFLHAGIKFPWFVFFQNKYGPKDAYDPPANMQIAMMLFSALCLIFGCFPNLLYAMLPSPVEFSPYTLGHVASQMQLLLASCIVFFILLPYLQRTTTISLDFDWFYRRLPKLVSGSTVILRCSQRYATSKNRAKHCLLHLLRQRAAFAWISDFSSKTAQPFNLITALVVVLILLLVAYYTA